MTVENSSWVLIYWVLVWNCKVQLLLLFFPSAVFSLLYRLTTKLSSWWEKSGILIVSQLYSDTKNQMFAGCGFLERFKRDCTLATLPKFSLFLYCGERESWDKEGRKIFSCSVVCNWRVDIWWQRILPLLIHSRKEDTEWRQRQSCLSFTGKHL